MVSPQCYFDGDYGGDNHNKEILNWVLDQIRRGAWVLATIMVDVEIIATDVSMEDGGERGEHGCFVRVR